MGNVLITRTNLSDTSLQSHGWTCINTVKQWDFVWISDAYLMVSRSPQAYHCVLANTDIVLGLL